MAGAGDLRDRFVIERDMAEPDWSGHPADPDWQTVVGPIFGGIEYLRGGEAVISGRLAARQTAILTIYTSAAARGIKPSDRAKDTRTGEIFNIREKPRPAKDDRGKLQMLVESGVSD